MATKPVVDVRDKMLVDLYNQVKSHEVTIKRLSIAVILIAIAGILNPIYRLFFQ